MRIVPDSTITLYSGVDVDIGENLVFSSLANQSSYFVSKIASAQVRVQMVKKTGRLMVDVRPSLIAQCNYLSWLNPSFDNKRIYARILDYDYINNECVEITYAIDYWQTWMFDIDFDESYIEREHLSQQQATLAASNPYDPSLVELRTAEDLPISPDVEKPAYDLTDPDDGDGVFIFEELADASSVNPDTIGAFILLGDIDFRSKDTAAQAGTTAPSEKFLNVLESVVADTWGYYELPIDTYEYLNLTYPATPPRVKKTATGSGWQNFTIDGTNYGNLTPNCSLMQMPCIKIYCQNMNTPSVGVSALEKLLAALTDMGEIDQIVSMYAIPNKMFVTSAYNSDGMFTATLETAKTKLSVRNPKLMLYPFSYLRVIAPNGDIKELRYENYMNVQNGDAQTGDMCTLDIVLDINGTPTLIIAPNNYKYNKMSPALDNMSANVIEALMFAQFATVPYSVDGWTAHLAALANSIIGNNTIDYSYDIQQKALNNYVGGALDQVFKGVDVIGDLKNKDFKQAARHSAEFITGGAQMDIDIGRMQNEFLMSEDAYRQIAGDKDNAVYRNFECTRPAFAGAMYHQSNGDGVVNFNLISFMDIIFMRVGLNPTVLARYDKYFDMYGYATGGRCGIPHVVKYSQGSNTVAELPDWHTVNGKQTTYVKTSNCHVIHSMFPVANEIEKIFDSGCRFIKGDLS